MIIEENKQAIQFAMERAPKDMIMTPVEVTEALLHKKVEATAPDLVVQGVRWYVEVNLRNMLDGTSAAALYRVWREKDQWKAIRLQLI